MQLQMLLFTQSRQVGFTLSIVKLNKIKKKYINFGDHRNSAIDIVDNSSPLISEIDAKPISGRGYRSCFNRFLLSGQYPNEIN